MRASGLHRTICRKCAVFIRLCGEHQRAFLACLRDMDQESRCRGTRRRIIRVAGAVLGTATLSLQPGCEDRRTVAYEIAKEFSPAASIPLSSGGGTHEVEPGGGPERAEPLTWIAPAHWKTKTVSAMRRASYAVPMNDGSDADLSISVLGGAAGGLPANINRWRAQLALPELSPGEVTGTTESIPAGGLMFTLIDIAGKSDDASVGWN